jgi:hydroxypyruvate reductase
MTHPADARRAVLTDVFRAGLRAAQGEALLTAYGRFDGRAFVYVRGKDRVRFDLPRSGRVVVVGAGKAAAALAAGLEAVLGDRIDLGRIVVKYGHGAPLRRIEVFEAAHPVPDAAGEAATRRILDAVSGLGPDDRVFVLITGGASALLVAPADGVTLEDKQAATELLLRSGAAIGEINVVRRRLSRVKGGGLLRAIGRARSLTLMISDIPSGDPALIGSGPTYPDPSAPDEALAIVERLGLKDRLPLNVPRRLAAPAAPVPSSSGAGHFVLADSAAALAAAARRAERLGYAVRILDPCMTGDARDAALEFAHALRTASALREPTVFLSAGETTLTVHGAGRGGRCQEFALVAARELDGAVGAALLAAGTDGTDGPTEAAGAFADGSTVARADVIGLNLVAALDDNDSHTALARLGDLFVTGPTGTNVMDLVVGVAGPII